MLGQPKRNGKCVNGHRGQCGCQRRINRELKQVAAKKPEALPTTCAKVCNLRTGKPCGATARGGVCPCPWC